MKAGQTLAVRIPSAEAYGDGDRIFEITIEHVDHAHHDDDDDH